MLQGVQEQNRLWNICLVFVSQQVAGIAPERVQHQKKFEKPLLELRQGGPCVLEISCERAK